jgi:protein arginine kinase
VSFYDHLNEPWSPWMADGGEAADVVVSSRARLARNVEGYAFPGRFGDEQAKKLLRQIEEAVTAVGPGWFFVGMMDLLPLDRQVLVEKHLISPELAQRPQHSALAMAPSEAEAMMINEEDHLRIQSFRPGLAVEAAYQAVAALDDQLETRLRFVFDPQLGYLSASPTNAGTGLRISVMMHLAGLSHAQMAGQMLAALAKVGVAIRGIYGEGTQAAGHLFQISNQVSLGRTEEELVQSVRSVALQVVEEERKARAMLAREHLSETQDRVFRSLAILQAARLISAEEALERISDVRLGVEMGLLPGPSLSLLSELMVISLPGFLHRKAGKDLSRGERLALRAAMIRERLKKEEI